MWILRLLVGLIIPIMCVLPMILLLWTLGALADDNVLNRIVGTLVFGSSFAASVVTILCLVFMVITGTGL